MSAETRFVPPPRTVGPMFHIPTHRHPYPGLSAVFDKVRRNGTPHQPKHCGCTACFQGFTHIAGTERAVR